MALFKHKWKDITVSQKDGNYIRTVNGAVEAFSEAEALRLIDDPNWDDVQEKSGSGKKAKKDSKVVRVTESDPEAAPDA